MLISFDELAKLGVEPSSVLHVGAHLAEEAADYDVRGFTPVFWVEANTDLREPLTERLSHFPGQHVAFAVVADVVKTVTFHLANNGQSSSYLELGTHETEHPEVKYIGERRLQTTTVDMLADRGTIGRAQMMNIDVQGAELQVLRGAQGYLRGVNVVYAEVNKEELYKGCALFGEVDAFLSGKGFVLGDVRWTRFQWGDAVWLRAS